jgi:hypothetical protein
LRAHRGGRASSERARIRDLERAAQRTGPQRLLSLDRRRYAAACRATLELPHGPEDHRDVRREHEQPHEEWHAARQRHPSRAAERRGATGEQQAGRPDGERNAHQEVHPPQAGSLAVD